MLGEVLRQGTAKRDRRVDSGCAGFGVWVWVQGRAGVAVVQGKQRTAGRAGVQGRPTGRIRD